MDKIKVMTVFGTRPEAIKMAPLIKKLEENEYIDSIVCVTAQHRQMLDQVLEYFKIKPDFDLNIMQEKQTLSGITNKVLERLEDIIIKVKPDIMLVHGDTTTTFAGSLAAFYNKVKVGHVEAGLRTFNKYFPYPEEMNRKLTGALADLHFAPTLKAKQNLLREGINEEDIFITGNTVIDAMESTVKKDYVFETKKLNKIDYNNKKVIMMTAHRRENWGKPLENICSAVKEIAERFKDVEFIYLVHLNPVVKDTVYGILGNVNNVHLLPPLDTKETHNLMNKCHFVLTDSGGLQEEAPHLGKPVLVLRDVTERPEAVEAGTVKVIGTQKDDIIREISILLSDENAYNKMAYSINPYGDGKASERIVEAILYHYGIINQKPQDFYPLKK
ncbi:UDP-N-acetylglucosamine 2-epimerase (non-hydrolyzing) [Caloramator sp. E03]|uniref:non-hydrolyzing UDP-N-acetylglucosamine 2-epimerase n=1 Tax=Caloramator sp. E03 TaxID=2576307 RepID=UPI00111063CF|nr:UDP-N-acetylglucosamine 2-epimerase (non-hydrolyzing) [Caloramator sp. E03]QCX33379.1 UDP-N-acetylglucosamine 2-epimerase (non-hydrolyzing) [Caloramator sp. E03]